MEAGVHCECGALLVDQIDERGVRPVGATESIPFRRVSDHVICTECLRSYDLPGLLDRAGAESVMELLDRMLELAREQNRPPPAQG